MPRTYPRFREQQFIFHCFSFPKSGKSELHNVLHWIRKRVKVVLSSTHSYCAPSVKYIYILLVQFIKVKIIIIVTKPRLTVQPAILTFFSYHVKEIYVRQNRSFQAKSFTHFPRWQKKIFPFTKKSYLHRVQWRYYFYLSRVRWCRHGY